MTEAQVWEYLRRRWQNATYRVRGYVFAQIMGKKCYFGLRGSLSALRSGGYITDEMYTRLRNRLNTEFGGDHRVGSWWPSTKGGAKVRAAACKYLAEVSKLSRSGEKI